MNDDDRLFAEEMAGVKPLEIERRVVIRKDDGGAVNIAARRAAATAQSNARNFLSTSEIELLNLLLCAGV